MAYEAPKAPHVNGIMEGLDETTVFAIQDQLNAIIDTFEPTEDAPVCDTFQLVSIYNSENEQKINGDTCEYVLAYVPSEGTEGEA